MDTDYFAEMRNLHGFASGKSIPPDAEARRRIYVITLNRIAEMLGSEMLAVAYNRDGSEYNRCLILYASVQDLSGYDDEALASGELDLEAITGFPQPEQPDDVMCQAIETMRKINVDQFVIVEPRLDTDAFRAFLEEYGHTPKTALTFKLEPVPIEEFVIVEPRVDRDAFRAFLKVLPKLVPLLK